MSIQVEASSIQQVQDHQKHPLAYIICLDDIEVIEKPCGHFREKSVLRWLQSLERESRASDGRQLCPYCRQHVNFYGLLGLLT